MDSKINTQIKILSNAGESIEKRLMAVNELFLIGKETVPSLINLLLSDDWISRWLATSTIVYIGRDAVPELHQNLKHENWKIRGGVAEILSIIKSPESVEHLKKLLHDDHEKVKYYAGLSLKRFNSE